MVEGQRDELDEQPTLEHQQHTHLTDGWHASGQVFTAAE
jgi:hypothetical protein